MSSLKLLRGVVYFLLFCLGSTILPESYSQNGTPTFPKSINKIPDSYILYEHPGRMVRLPRGNLLSLYCEGKGKPTIMLETGFGGGAYAAWYRLQPRLAKITRTCSYDRAGYGFSELGNDLPRDLYHDVSDLYELLKASGEPAPYILVGHSDGGHIIGAFADSHPQEIAGLVFLDAAVLIDKQQVEGAKEEPSSSLQKYFSNQLQQIRTCLKRAENSAGDLKAKPGDYCLDSEKLKRLPSNMAKALIEISSRPDSWRAFLSEAEQHYLVDDDSWEVSLLPHRWQEIPILVFTASVASLDDAHSAAAYGLPPSDHKAIEAARTGRKRWEHLQSRLCELSTKCEFHLIPTAEHQVQNAVPDLVAESMQKMVLDVRRSWLTTPPAKSLPSSQSARHAAAYGPPDAPALRQPSLATASSQ